MVLDEDEDNGTREADRWAIVSFNKVKVKRRTASACVRHSAIRTESLEGHASMGIIKDHQLSLSVSVPVPVLVLGDTKWPHVIS